MTRAVSWRVPVALALGVLRAHRPRALPLVVLCTLSSLAPIAPLPAAAQDATRPRVGVALSGGSAKGFAHIGVLREIERAGVAVDVVAGTSMGSLVGGLYATGLSLDSIEAIVTGATWGGGLADEAERERRFLHQRRFDERAILTLPVEGGGVRLPAGVSSGSQLIRLAELATWRAATTRSFTDLPRPFTAVATDVITGQAVPLRRGVLAEAMRASSGVPGVFAPFDLDGRLLVDGALSRNLPASDARALGADILICSDVSDPLATAEDLESVLDVVDQVINLGMRVSMVEQRALCDVVVRTDVDELSGFAFDRAAEWIERGRVAAVGHEVQLRAIARRQGHTGPLTALEPLPKPVGFLDDSVRVDRVSVEGSERTETQRLVRNELRLEAGDYVTPARLDDALADVDATGLFRLVWYRLERVGDGARLAVHVQESPRDRFGVGLRYDDERRAALLFTTTVHNVMRYGSVTRLDLRVGEETRARISYLRRQGITGRFEGGTTVSWSQGRLPLPLASGEPAPETLPTAQIELTTIRTALGIVGERTSFIGVEATAEWAASDEAAVSDALLVAVAGVFDHESLDRIDFPRRGSDATARWEWGISDLVPGEEYSVATASARFHLPLHADVSADFGGFMGFARGEDLPWHRTLFLGGQHPSAIFEGTQPLFAGLAGRELQGRAAQVGRFGLTAYIGDVLNVRAGIDVGGIQEAWRFPVDDPFVAWSVSLGATTLVGPAVLEYGKAEGRSGRVSLSVGRRF